jgi:hypothetical protein
MTALLPRLDREQTLLQIEDARTLTVAEIAALMPVTDVRTTSSALGGMELPEEALRTLRSAILELAGEYGYPDPGTRLPHFDARCARLLHETLGIAPHEASEEDAWSHLTCCWLLDVAAWRWDGVGSSDPRRFRGDVNRNTFRRLWWRAEILGPDIDLTLLGEDELVSIMERPTVASNRPLARSLVNQFLARVQEADSSGRMMLMREAGKRLRRLTPMIDFHALDKTELDSMMGDILDAAASGEAMPATQPLARTLQVSEGVEQIPRAPVLDAPSVTPAEESGTPTAELEDLFEVALSIARRTGRVTNSALREVAPIDSLAARRVLQDLVERGSLARRGQAKGTYYVLPTEPPTAASERPRASSTRPGAPSWVPAAEKTLRRFLNRRRTD